MKYKTHPFFIFKALSKNRSPAGAKAGSPVKNPACDRLKQRAEAGGGTKADRTAKNPDRFVYAHRGMTLIEIMIVVGIIAFLVGVVGKGVMDRFQKSKAPQAKIVIGLLEQSLAEFNMDCGYYPPTLDDLISGPADCEEWDGPYLKNGKIPKDPWKNELVYEIDEETGDYNIISFGADKKPQGKGLNKDISSND